MKERLPSRWPVHTQPPWQFSPSWIADLEQSGGLRCLGRLRLVCSERMRRKLRFFDGCVMAVINLSASNMSMSTMVGRPSSAMCKSRMRRIDEQLRYDRRMTGRLSLASLLGGEGCLPLPPRCPTPPVGLMGGHRLVRAWGLKADLTGTRKTNCFGGMVVLEMARDGQNDLAGVVSFHGGTGDADAAQALQGKMIKTPFLMPHASQAWKLRSEGA